MACCIRMASDLVKREAFAHPEIDTSGVTEEQLRWVRPVSQDGATEQEWEEALRRHPNPNREQEASVSLDDLDPTQRDFAEVVLSWARSMAYAQKFGRPHPQLQAVLLGTAGTGKTTTLKAVLQQLEALPESPVRKYLVCAFTGVAASSVGSGARTLHDPF